MIKPVIAVMLIAGWSTAAQAAPVYLRCTFDNAEPIAVTVDEAEGRATVFLASRSNTMVFDAAFTADQVNFQDRLLAYTIDRTTLVIRRTIKMISVTDVGQCAIQQAPQRAF